MIEHSGRTNIGSVVFLDIVGYSKATDANQMAMKRLLNGLIGQAVEGIVQAERIILDTGDGAAICFLGDPEDALFVATAVLSAVREETGDARQQLRVGINLGAIKAITDLNGHPNVVGDGINVAQRIMGFADIDEILVSRSYYEVVSRLKEGNDHLFIPMGMKKDKHVREHQLYAISPEAISAIGHRSRDAESDDPPASPLEVRGGGTLPADQLATAERRLADRIGPLAPVIIRKAAATAATMGELYDTAALVIQDRADRDAFLAARPSEPEPSAGAPAAPVVQRSLNEADLIDAERLLAEVIGPVASVLVEQVAREVQDREALFERLAARINSEAARRRFLDSLPT